MSKTSLVLKKLRVRSLIDTVNPIPAGPSLVSGSSIRQSYRAQIYRLYSPPSPHVNDTTVVKNVSQYLYPAYINK